VNNRAVISLTLSGEQGFFCIVAGCACLGSVALFGIGRDDGGPFFVYGFILDAALGAAFLSLWFRAHVLAQETNARRSLRTK